MTTSTTFKGMDTIDGVVLKGYQSTGFQYDISELSLEDAFDYLKDVYGHVIDAKFDVDGGYDYTDIVIKGWVPPTKAELASYEREMVKRKEKSKIDAKRKRETRAAAKQKAIQDAIKLLEKEKPNLITKDLDNEQEAAILTGYTVG